MRGFIDRHKFILFLFGILFLMLLVASCGRSSDGTKKTTSGKKPRTSATPAQTASPSEKKETSFRDFNEGLKKDVNNQWNLNRGGYIARNAEHYYYADEKMGLLYKVNINSNDRLKLTNDPYVSNINISEGWVYYTPMNFRWYNNEQGVKYLAKEGGRLMKVDLDGQNQVASNFYAYKVILDGSLIYFTNAKDLGRLYVCDLNFGRAFKLSDEAFVADFFIDGNEVYYSGKDGIFKCRLDGSQKTVVIRASDIQNFGVADGFVYYLGKDSKYLYKASLDRTDDRKLLLSDVTDYFVIPGTIFYKLGSGNIIKASLENLSVSAVELESFPSFSIIGNVLFGAQSKVGWIAKNGYTIKYRVEGGRKVPLAKDDVDVRLGIDHTKVLDYAMNLVDMEDRNKILLDLSRNFNKFFQGNSMPVMVQLLDSDEDRLPELFVLTKQFVSDPSTLITGVEKINQFQTTLYMYKWAGKKLTVLGPYPLTNAEKIIAGEYQSPRVKLADVEPGGYQEVLMDLGNKDRDSAALFRVSPAYLEPMIPKLFSDRLRQLNNDIR